MGKVEKKKQITDRIENLPESILDHVLSYVKELEEKIESENLDEFLIYLDNKYHNLLGRLAK